MPTIPNKKNRPYSFISVGGLNEFVCLRAPPSKMPTQKKMNPALTKIANHYGQKQKDISFLDIVAGQGEGLVVLAGKERVAHNLLYGCPGIRALVGTRSPIMELVPHVIENTRPMRKP